MVKKKSKGRTRAGIFQVVLEGKKGTRVSGKIKAKSVFATTVTSAKRKAAYWMGGKKKTYKVKSVKKVA